MDIHLRNLKKSEKENLVVFLLDFLSFGEIPKPLSYIFWSTTSNNLSQPTEDVFENR
ncbi:hypothetical protein HMPREF9189_1109 [Streptococcus sp. oral taxon 071 str. 73H25AP]|uniref:Uncharacterized protein n=1 Tax=Streptococcus mitis SK597 TaxID=585204 RepID=E1LRE4_STRMT|nr:hypothetical protein HMPREF9189_1109 [Streptococcus sp. oral taxon 071 str. 73H25AP]EFO00967.1 hypothetical protein SMSK597_0542 [Streptococcus mitis SK597]